MELITIKKLLLFISTVFMFAVPAEVMAANTITLSGQLDKYKSLLEREEEDYGIRPEDVDGAVIHEPVVPLNYDEIDLASLPEEGEQRDYNPNTLSVDDFIFSFEDLRGNRGSGDDFDYLNQILDQNLVAYVGMDGMNTFFGHYYDLTGTGVFNPLADMDLLNEGTEVVITDAKGYSKGYEISQIIEFLHKDQGLQFYGKDYMPNLAYFGNGDDMVYIQYCRWDIQNGLLITNIGYRVW